MTGQPMGALSFCMHYTARLEPPSGFFRSAEQARNRCERRPGRASAFAQRAKQPQPRRSGLVDRRPFPVFLFCTVATIQGILSVILVGFSPPPRFSPFCHCMPAQWCRRQVAMDLGVYQLRHFSISFLSSLLGTDSSALSLDSR